MADISEKAMLLDVQTAMAAYGNHLGRYNVNVAVTDQLLEIHGKPVSEVVDTAVGLLIQQSAVIVDFINMSNKVTDDGDFAAYYEHKRIPLGFNDHDGGSESDYKIALNGAPVGTTSVMRELHVLYSPPLLDGTPSNMTFHHADFTQLDCPPVRPTYDLLPNATKTAGARIGRGDLKPLDPQFYLFGASDVPRQFFRRFADIGFAFSDQPYESMLTSEGRTSKLSRLAAAEAEATKLGHRAMRYWPAGQFEPQLRQLGMQPIINELYPL